MPFDSTEVYTPSGAVMHPDRGEKFAHYETIGSVREFVLASQKAPRLEVFTRQSDQSWVRRVYGGAARRCRRRRRASLPVSTLPQRGLRASRRASPR